MPALHMAYTGTPVDGIRHVMEPMLMIDPPVLVGLVVVSFSDDDDEGDIIERAIHFVKNKIWRKFTFTPH